MKKMIKLEEQINNIDENIFSDDSMNYDEQTLQNTNPLQRNLEIKKYDRMIKDIISSINDNSIILTPEYQRNYLWDNKKASKLVESILLNIPIPVIYASEEQNGKWNVVDGLQRLNSLKRFYLDEFKLTGLEILSKFNGLKYSELPEQIRSRIDRGDLTIILLLSSSSPEIQYDIFMRLNSGAVQLNEQELRNCLYRGTLNDKIKNELIYNSYFKEIFNWDIMHKRMIDVETILRYLAFSENYEIKNNQMINYDGRVKNLINNFMVKYQNASISDLERFEKKFNSGIKKCYEVFGKQAFRKKNANGNYDTRINRPLYETIMICFEKYTLGELIEKKSLIIDKTEELILSSEFNDYISTATGNTIKVNGRLTEYSNMLGSIFNDREVN